MSLSDYFSFRMSGVAANVELPNIYPFPVDSNVFIEQDITGLYQKILSECLDRAHGLKDEHLNALYDNCLQSESSSGLITMLARAMFNKGELFLVYKLGVLRTATNDEKTLIKDDYEKKGGSSLGIYISFKNLAKTDVIKIYSGMKFCVLETLFKGMKLSSALQLKFKDLRPSVSNEGSDSAKTQASAIAESLKKGVDVLLDAEDTIETHKPEMEAAKQALEFIYKEESYSIGMPLSYITGEQTGGIGSTGEGDMRAIEQGIMPYFNSILKPVLKAIFNVEITFKSKDFRLVTSALEALKTFELIGDDIVSKDEKKQIIQKLLGIESK